MINILALILLAAITACAAPPPEPFDVVTPGGIKVRYDGDPLKIPFDDLDAYYAATLSCVGLADIKPDFVLTLSPEKSATGAIGTTTFYSDGRIPSVHIQSRGTRTALPLSVFAHEVIHFLIDDPSWPNPHYSPLFETCRVPG